MNGFTAAPGELAIDVDHLDPICATCKEPESACLCEPDLLGTVEDLTRTVAQLSGELEGLKQGDREAADLAQQVIQATTLDEAKLAARVFLGLAEPF